MKLKLPENATGFTALGVMNQEDGISIYFRASSSQELQIATSADGIEFEKTEGTFKIYDMAQKETSHQTLESFKISPLFKDHILFYQIGSEKMSNTYTARSGDLKTWQTFSKMPDGMRAGIMVENYIHKDRHVFYFSGKTLKLGLTENGEDWIFNDIDFEVSDDIEVDYVQKTSQGIFLLYHNYLKVNGTSHLEVKSVCFDKQNPSKIIWHNKSSLWEAPKLWPREASASCLGCFIFQGKILSYWNVPDVGIYLVTYPFFSETPAHEHDHYRLTKHPKNPILAPHPEHSWENEAVFNAAAFHDNGTVYLIYRAVGYGYISVLGLAQSRDGVRFEKRLPEPIYTGNHDFDTKKTHATLDSARKYMSGGGYGGCEDPRITKIGNMLYMVYVAFNGFDPPRLALTSIAYKDFINHRFLWEKPVLISPPGVVDKSGCILPEKINGKFVFFHRIYPDILIDFLPSLEFDGTKWLKGEHKISPRPTMWDSRKVGTGAPPIKTKDGWLLIYQGVNDRDDSKYKIGAMLLDLHDPTKVLFRSNHPIIEPTENYENNLAKFGVVYPCGAVIKDGNLFVYYGGSDSVTCVASANLEEFLQELKAGSQVHLKPVTIND